jgi:DNA-binding SARP family transcriptional activator
MRSTAALSVSSVRTATDAAIHEQLEISLLGALLVRYAGRSLPLRVPHAALRVLAYLLLHRGRTLSREHVAFTLWPDDDPGDARANLRRKLHLLGRALPPSREPWIVTTPASVAWNEAAPYRLDIAEFTILSADHATMLEADALYTGDLLADLDDDWIVDARERLRTRAMDNLIKLIARLQQRRDFAGAIRLGQRLRILDPWREDTVRTLIALRYDAGDRAGALAEYERFAASLAAEMGVEPMPETVCVYERILAHAPPTPASSSSPEPSHSARTGSGLPFAGRAREMLDLHAAWTAASNGTGCAVLVAGEVGIGKSRLIEEFATVVAANGARVLRGGTSPFELGPYQPIAEALRTALPILRQTRVEPLWLAVLATLVPDVRVAFPALSDITPLDARAERTRLFEAIDRLIDALAIARPTVIILEDVHWAGFATIALLEHLARRAPLHRLLIVASYREESLARTHPLRAMRRRLEREGRLRVVALGPLDASAIEAIVGEFVAETPARRAEIARDLQPRCDGNPFFLSEVIANDRESGRFDDAARQWSSSDPPRSLRSTLRARLERLSPGARSVIEVAAVIGRSFSTELVREASGISERSALDGLGELVDRRLIREVGTGTTDFAFSHELIAQAAYAELSPQARTRRHRRVGNLMEELYGEQLEAFASEIAAHLDRGGEAEHAAEYYCLAARHTLSLHGSDEARVLASRGLELAGREADVRFRLVEILEEASRRLGDRAAQSTHVAQLLAIARAGDDAERLREAVRRQIVLAHDQGQRDHEQAAIAELAGLIAGVPGPWQTMFAQLKGSFLTAIGSYREARIVMSDALGSVDEHDHPRIYVDCWCALIDLAGFEGRVAEVRAFLDDVPAFERRADLAQAVTVLETACAAASRIQDYTVLDACAARLLACSRSIGYRSRPDVAGSRARDVRRARPTAQGTSVDHRARQFGHDDRPVR